jgi:hypothetical protein
MPHLPPVHHEIRKHDSPNETKIKEKQNETIPDLNSNLAKSMTHHNQTKELTTWFLTGAGLSALLIPALVRGHLLNLFMSFLNTESEERTSSNNIYVLPGWANQPMIEALDDKPLLHVVMGACKDIILQAFPCLGDGLISELLKPRDLVLEGIGFAQQKKLGKKCIWALLLGWHYLLIGIEPLFHLF